jgi:hypothetical protein
MTVRQTKSASYEVGYGKPPRRTQFRKGQSGNPGGRPQGRPQGRPMEYVKEMALQEAYRTVIVKREDGDAVPMSAVRAVLCSQFESAAAGNARAQCAVLAMIRDLESDKAFDARNPQYRRDAVIDAAADRDDADHDGDDDDDADEGEGEGEADTDEIGTDAETQQEDRAKSAAPPSSANSAPPLKNAAAPAVKSPAANSPVMKSPAVKSRTVKSPPPAAGGGVRKGAVARHPASKKGTPSKRRVRRERGRSACTAAARKATTRPAASPGLQAGGTPALRSSVSSVA